MGRWIVRLAEDEYVEWSTVVDAPVTWITSRKRAVEKWGPDRVGRADVYVTSARPREGDYETAKELVRGNRAGENEEELTLGELREAYRR